MRKYLTILPLLVGGLLATGAHAATSAPQTPAAATREGNHSIVVRISDLLHAVGRWDRNENRLVEAATHQLNLAAIDKRFQAGEIFFMPGGNPLPERPREMQCNTNARMPLKRIEEGQITLTISTIENILEVPNRLVRVQQQYEMKSTQAPSPASRFKIPH